MIASRVGPVEGDLAVAQEHGPSADAVDRGRVVGDEDDRATALLELEDLPEALALELLVAHGEDLVQQQHVDLEMRGDRETEPHVHPRRVRAHRDVDEALQLREGDDLVHVPPDVLALEAENGAVQVDVLAARELRVEAGAELEQRADAALDGNGAGGRLDDPRDEPEQRRLPGAVAADQPDRLAGRDARRDVAQRPDVRPPRATPRDEQLLERANGLRVDAEAAAGAVDLDGARLRHALEGSAAARRTMPARTRTKAGSAFGISIRS